MRPIHVQLSACPLTSAVVIIWRGAPRKQSLEWASFSANACILCERLRTLTCNLLSGECLNSLQLATWSINGLAHCAAAVLVPLLAFEAGDDEVRFDR